MNSVSLIPSYQPIPFREDRIRKFLDYKVQIGRDTPQTVLVQEVVQAILREIKKEEILEYSELTFGGSYLTYLLTGKGPYQDADLKILCVGSNPSGELIFAMERAVARALSSLVPGLEPQETLRSLGVKATSPLSFERKGSFLTIASCSLKPATNYGESIPLEISMNAFQDPEIPKHILNTDSFRVFFKPFEGEDLGSKGPEGEEEPGKYWVYSYEGDAGEVKKEVEQGNLGSSVSLDVGTFGWFRVIREITRGKGTLGYREIHENFSRAENKLLIAQFLGKKPEDIFCLFNVMFHLSEEDLNQDQEDPDHRLKKALLLSLQSSKHPFLATTFFPMLADLTLKESVSVLKIFLSCSCSKISKKSHLGEVQYECKFQERGSSYHLFVPPLTEKDVEILIQKVPLIETSNLLREKERFPAGAFELLEPFMDEYILSSGKQSSFFLELLEKMSPTERSEKTLYYSKKIIEQYRGRLQDLPVDFWSRLETCVSSILSYNGCRKAPWKEMFHHIFSDLESAPSLPIRAFLKMLSEKLYGPHFLRDLSYEHLPSIEKWFGPWEDRLPPHLKIFDLLQKSNIQKALRVLYYKGSSLDFLSMQKELQKKVKDSEDGITIYLGFLTEVLKREESREKQCEIALEAYLAFGLDDTMSEFLEKSCLLDPSNAPIFREILKNKKTLKKTVQDIFAYRIEKIAREQKFLFAYNLLKSSAELFDQSLSFSEIDSLLGVSDNELPKRRMKMILQVIDDRKRDSDLLSEIQKSPVKMEWIRGLAHRLDHLEEDQKLKVLYLCIETVQENLEESYQVASLILGRMDLYNALKGSKKTLEELEHLFAFLEKGGIPLEQTAQAILEDLHRFDIDTPRLRLEWEIFPFLGFEAKQKYLSRPLTDVKADLFFMIHEPLYAEIPFFKQRLEERQKSVFSQVISELESVFLTTDWTAEEKNEIVQKAISYFSKQATDEERDELFLHLMQLPLEGPAIKSLLEISLVGEKNLQDVPLKVEQVRKGFTLLKSNPDALKAYVKIILSQDLLFSMEDLSEMAPYVDDFEPLIIQSRKKSEEILQTSGRKEAKDFILYLKKQGLIGLFSQQYSILLLDVMRVYLTSKGEERASDQKVIKIIRSVFEQKKELSKEEESIYVRVSFLLAAVSPADMKMAENAIKMCSFELLESLIDQAFPTPDFYQILFFQGVVERVRASPYDVHLLAFLQRELLILEPRQELGPILSSLGEHLISVSHEFSHALNQVNEQSSEVSLGPLTSELAKGVSYCTHAVRKVLKKMEGQDSLTLSQRLFKEVQLNRLRQKDKLNYWNKYCRKNIDLEIDTRLEFELLVRYIRDMKLQPGEGLIQAIQREKLPIMDERLEFLINRIYLNFPEKYSKENIVTHLKLIDLANPLDLPEEQKLSKEEVFIHLKLQSDCDRYRGDHSMALTRIEQFFGSLDRLDKKALPYSSLFKEVFDWIETNLDDPLLKQQTIFRLVEKCKEEMTDLTELLAPSEPLSLEERKYREATLLILIHGMSDLDVRYGTWDSCPEAKEFLYDLTAKTTQANLRYINGIMLGQGSLFRFFKEKDQRMRQLTFWKEVKARTPEGANKELFDQGIKRLITSQGKK